MCSLLVVIDAANWSQLGDGYDKTELITRFAELG